MATKSLFDFIQQSNIINNFTPQKRVFEPYSPGYMFTNEDLRQLPNIMPKNCKNVLTVAGSGDHPLYCSLYGATHVDTFDICYHAKCIMDIKTSAITCLNYKDYCQLLDDLYMFDEGLYESITDIPKMDNILQNLCTNESEYLKHLHSSQDKIVFINRRKRPKLSPKIMITSSEYKNLHKVIIEPYNFWLTDIKNLSKHLTKSYDFIHLSNILDYIQSTEHKDIILPLLNHVNPGGRILIENFVLDSDGNRLNSFINTGLEITKLFDTWRFFTQPNKIYLDGKFVNAFVDGTCILERII